MIRLALLPLLLLPLADCALRPPIEASSAVGFWCRTNDPEQPTRAQYASFSLKQKQQMATHNGYGAAHCGWKP